MVPTPHDRPAPTVRAARGWVTWPARSLVLAGLLTGGLLVCPPHPVPTPTSDRAAGVSAADRQAPVSRSAARDQASAPTPTTLTLVDGGARTVFTTSTSTLAEALTAHAVVLAEGDLLTPAPGTPLTGAPLEVTITRTTTVTLAQETKVAHASRTVDDPTMTAGTSKVTQPGSDGLTRTVYSVVRNAATGAELSRQVTLTVQVSTPVDEVVAHGTKPAPVPPVTPAPPTPPASTAPDPGTARALGAQAVAAHGWDASQFTCLDTLWAHESGWSPTAANGSGAYGIPQALPGSKMATAGADWATNPATQIAWGLGYITARYGSPCQAWATWQTQHWY